MITVELTMHGTLAAPDAWLASGDRVECFAMLDGG
jgi:hypothetical protein